MLRVSKITKDLNPKKIYKLISKFDKTKYFLMKFGFNDSNFENILNHPDVTFVSVKNNIKTTMQHTGMKVLSPEIIIASIIKSNPMYVSILSSMMLELEDLYDGIRFSSDSQKFLLSNQTDTLDSIKMILSRSKHKKIMLIGDDSCGKSHLLKNYINNSKYIDANKFIKQKRSTIENKLNSVFLSNEFTTVIIDNANLILEETFNSQDHSELFNHLKIEKQIIISINTTNYKKLKNRLPKYFNDFYVIKMKSFTKEESLKILFNWSKKIEKQKDILFTYNSLKTSYELSHNLTKDKPNVSTAIAILEKTIDNTKSKRISALEVCNYLESLGIYIEPVISNNYYIFSTLQPSLEQIKELVQLDNDIRIYSFDAQLNSILDLEIILDSIKLNPNAIIYLQNIDHANQRLASFIHQIMDDRYYESMHSFIDLKRVIFVGFSQIDDSVYQEYKNLGYENFLIEELITSKFKSNTLINRFDRCIVKI